MIFDKCCIGCENLLMLDSEEYDMCPVLRSWIISEKYKQVKKCPYNQYIGGNFHLGFRKGDNGYNACGLSSIDFLMAYETTAEQKDRWARYRSNFISCV